MGGGRRNGNGVEGLLYPRDDWQLNVVDGLLGDVGHGADAFEEFIESLQPELENPALGNMDQHRGRPRDGPGALELFGLLRHPHHSPGCRPDVRGARNAGNSPGRRSDPVPCPSSLRPSVGGGGTLTSR